MEINNMKNILIPNYIKEDSKQKKQMHDWIASKHYQQDLKLNIIWVSLHYLAFSIVYQKNKSLTGFQI